MIDAQGFPGFDPTLGNADDFVLAMTQDIWEDHGLTRLGQYFAEDVIFRDAALVSQGPNLIHQDLLSTLVMFPDLSVLTEDVIWCEAKATRDAPRGFYASQRATTKATHTGAGLFGAPTSRPISYRTFTDGWFADGAARDVWRVRDTSALLRQLGTAPKEWVTAQLEANGLPMPLVPDTDPEGPYPERGIGTAASDDFEAMLRQIMLGDFSAFSHDYDRACDVVRPGAHSGIGQRDAAQFWIALRAAFPSAAFRVEHATGRTDPGQADRVAVRWSLYGKHDGSGAYGTATGKFVYILGITHAEFGPRGVRREWTLIDDSAIWTQIMGT